MVAAGAQEACLHNSGRRMRTSGASAAYAALLGDVECAESVSKPMPASLEAGAGADLISE